MDPKRMRVYSIVAGAIGILLIIVYVISKSSQTSQRTGGAYGSGEDSLTLVLVATKDIPANKKITGDMVTTKKISREGVMPFALQDMPEQTIVGQMSKEDISVGSQILATQVAPPGYTESLVSKIPGEGMRALSLPVGGITGLAGLLNPGNYVDIIGTFNRSGETSITTVTLLQNVLVLAVGERIGSAKPDKSYSSVTVAVTVEEAELLTLAINTGTTLTLSLRFPGDSTIVNKPKEKKLSSLLDIKDDLTERRNRRVIVDRGSSPKEIR